MKSNLVKTFRSTFGRNIKITVFGGSHEDHIGVVMEGSVFSPEEVDQEALQTFLRRRAPGNSPYATARKEDDIPILTSRDPVTYIIENKDRRSRDYEIHRTLPRPGHADYTAYLKYGASSPPPNMAGGGPFSGRMTAPLCVAGGIALQILAKQGVAVSARLISAGGVSGEGMYPAILEAKARGDSLGGQVAAVVTGFPAGVGGPMYDGLESFLAPILFGIPGVKGLSFGAGFQAARLHGSENNDPFCIENGCVRTKTNHAGGILGGISTGMPITLDVAFKPTPSISLPQQSVDLSTGKETTLSITGRHDPCIAVRGVPVVEAAAALGLLDALLEEKT